MPVTAAAPAAKTFPVLLRRIINSSTDGTARGFARAVNATPSQISHWLKGTTRPGVEICLRIAHYSGTNAAQLLRAAGHHEMTDLVEDLFGRAAQRRAHAMSQLDRQVHGLVNQIDGHEKRAVLCILRHLVEAAGQRRGPRGHDEAHASRHEGR